MMWPYWLVFGTVAIAALASRTQPVREPASAKSIKYNLGWALVAIALGAFVGFRHRVGADWANYLRKANPEMVAKFPAVIFGEDPGYYFINWSVVNIGGNVYFVNLICGLVGAFGLIAFCRTQPRPFLAVAVAVPYMVIVVMMGYTRQGAALGLGMLGLAALSRAKVREYIFWALVAATFHKSAVVLLPLTVLGCSRNRWVMTLLVGCLTAVSCFVFLWDQLDHLYANYIEAEYHSAGALVRLGMNGLAAGILLIWRRRFTMSETEQRIWWWVALFALALLVVYPIFPSTTVLDRLGLFFIPLQLVVFAHLPDVFGRTRRSKHFWVLLILSSYALVQFVWLNFADNAPAWKPYQFYPLVAS